MDWGSMLDRLSQCITLREEISLRELVADKDRPSHLADLHNLVFRLLIEHGITNRHLLQVSFPCAHSPPSIVCPHFHPCLDQG